MQDFSTKSLGLQRRALLQSAGALLQPVLRAGQGLLTPLIGPPDR